MVYDILCFIFSYYLTILFIYSFIFVCVYVICLQGCLYTKCVPGAQKPEEGIRFSETDL